MAVNTNRSDLEYPRSRGVKAGGVPPERRVKQVAQARLGVEQVESTRGSSGSLRPVEAIPRGREQSAENGCKIAMSAEAEAMEDRPPAPPAAFDRTASPRRVFDGPVTSACAIQLVSWSNRRSASNASRRVQAITLDMVIVNVHIGA